MIVPEKNPHRDGATTVDLPLSAEMAEQLRRLLHKAVRSGYGQIETTINPRAVQNVLRQVATNRPGQVPLPPLSPRRRSRLASVLASQTNHDTLRSVIQRKQALNCNKKA